jgi:hypothetical protein
MLLCMYVRTKGRENIDRERERELKFKRHENNGYFVWSSRGLFYFFQMQRLVNCDRWILRSCQNAYFLILSQQRSSGLACGLPHLISN